MLPNLGDMTDRAHPLAGKTCLVTGSTAGIGLAIARAFLEAGAAGVMLNGRDHTRAERARQALSQQYPEQRVGVAVGDVAMGAADQIVAETMSLFGKIDVVVNSTGGDTLPALFHKQDSAVIPTDVAAGLLGPILTSRAAIPYMMEKNAGCIINIASDAAKIATPGESVIGAIMAGIVMFTRGLAIEAKRNAIRVNCITPSIVSGTPLYDRLMADGFSGKLFAKAEQMAHLGVAAPQDLANLAVFLASDAASKITGQAISVNGGISAA